MKEGEPKFSVSTPLVERGTQRFSWKRVLIGAAIGAVALPVMTLGLSSLAGILSNVPASELPAIARVVALQAVTGAALGGIIAHQVRRP